MVIRTIRFVVLTRVSMIECCSSLAAVAWAFRMRLAELRHSLVEMEKMVEMTRLSKASMRRGDVRWGAAADAGLAGGRAGGGPPPMGRKNSSSLTSRSWESCHCREANSGSVPPPPVVVDSSSEL